jgi:hypothetical protein
MDIIMTSGKYKFVTWVIKDDNNRRGMGNKI